MTYRKVALFCLSWANFAKEKNVLTFQNSFYHKFYSQAKFAYTMFFLLIPWPFFIYEFFTSRQYHIFVNQWRDIVKEISSCNGMYLFIFDTFEKFLLLWNYIFYFFQVLHLLSKVIQRPSFAVSHLFVVFWFGQ